MPLGKKKRRQRQKVRKDRRPDPAEFAARGSEGRRRTGFIWLGVAALGLVVTVLGVLAPPLLVVGLLFLVAGCVMAVVNFRKAGG